MIRAIGERDGVNGLLLYNRFLEPRWEKDKSIPVSMYEQLQRRANYMADLIGWNHISIGSDLDGGLGLEESPLEIDTVADLNKIGAVVPLEARDAVLKLKLVEFP